MQLEQLTLHNFRNIERAELQPHRYFTVFYGLNGQGKTNLLESICLLGSLKSFRTPRNEDLIRHGQKAARISGRTLRNQVRLKMQLDISRDGKTARLNDKLVSQPDDYLDCLRPVIFSPEEVGLAKGGPAGRRRLLDRAVFQATPGYLRTVQDYERQLRQRNRLLKKASGPAELEPWTVALIETGARIRLARKEYITAIAADFAASYDRICNGREQAELSYRPEQSGIEALQAAFAEELQRSAEQERRYGMTLSGPHRDDISFRIGGQSLRDFGSQGQQRSFILALKTAQVLDLKQRYGEAPLLLLDDLLGELDRQRQDYLFRFLLQIQGQVFITTTDQQPLRQSGIGEGLYLKVEDGVLHS